MNLAPKVQPNISFAPIIMNALTTGSGDPTLKDFEAKLGKKLVQQLLDAWKKMPDKEKFRQFDVTSNWAPPLRGGNFAEQMAMQSKLFKDLRKELIRNRKKIIKKEIDRALSLGIGNYTPSAIDPTLRYEAASWMNKMFFYTCRCKNPGNSPEPPPVPPAKFGLKVTRIVCVNQREMGHDQIFLISAVCDGKGQVVTSTSDKYSIDDDSDDVVYPNYYIYPMQDPGNFLDAAVALWECNGGWNQVSGIVSSFGSAVGAIPHPYAQAASILLKITAEIISIIGYLDRDDHYGDAYKTWPSKANLEGGVGSYPLIYYEVDTGLWDDGHEFEVDLNLLTA